MGFIYSGDRSESSLGESWCGVEWSQCGVLVEQSGVNYMIKWSEVESGGVKKYKSDIRVELSYVSAKIEWWGSCWSLVIIGIPDMVSL